MDSKILFVLLLLPGLAHAAICKTVGADGVVSFMNVPGAECPQGSKIPGYSRPQPVAEQADVVTPGITGREVSFAGYRSIEILSPPDGGTVRSNEGRLSVLVELQPGLEQSHFITAYIDGRAFRGRYGSSQIELTRIDRGTHELLAKVSDSGGKTLIESRVISFTLLSVVASLSVNPITGDNYLDRHDPALVKVRGLYKGTEKEGTEISLWFPQRQKETRSVPVMEETKTEKSLVTTIDGTTIEVTETYNWEILVPRGYLQTESTFEARARQASAADGSVQPLGVGLLRPADQETGAIRARMTSRFTVDSALSSRPYDPSAETDYNLPSADYSPPQSGISTTPGTNPAFKPNYGTR